MFEEYKRHKLDKESKDLHLTKIHSLMNEPHWREVKWELEDALLKVYDRYDICKNHDEFLHVQGEALALKRLYGLDDLISRIARQRFGFRAPV